MGIRLKLSDDKHTMHVEAHTRKELQRECNRLTKQVDWELTTSAFTEGVKYPYSAEMEK